MANWVTSPLQVIHEMMLQSLQSNSNAAKAAPHAWGERAALDAYLAANAAVMTSIPEICRATDIQRCAPNSLVRMKCMVQDILNPTMFPVLYRVQPSQKVFSSKYREYLRDGHAHAMHDQVLAERVTMVSVTIPALNQWCRSASAAEVTQPPQQQQQAMKKRGRNTDRDVYALTGTHALTAHELQQQPGIGSLPPTAPTTRTTTTEGGEEEVKKLRDEISAFRAAASPPPPPNRNVLAESLLHHVPVPCEDPVICALNFYDYVDVPLDQKLVLNSMVEVIGVLSEVVPTADDDISEEELSSVVNRIHVITYRKVDHCNPIYRAPQEWPQGCSLPQVRARLLEFIAEVMWGDTLTAHYLLLWMLSNSYKRVHGLVLGKFSLSLVCQTDQLAAEASARVSNLVALIAERMHVLPLDAHINTHSLVPGKDYQRNKLQTAPLQLTDGTLLILDDSHFPAALNDVGVKNMKALSQIITAQELRYDFTYHELTFHTDFPVLIIQGPERKSNLPFDVQTCLQVTKNTCEPNLDAHVARSYLTYLRLQAAREDQRIQISADGSQALQEAYKQLQMTEMEFHAFVTANNLMELSIGGTAVTRETSQMAASIEMERKKRCTLL